MKSKNIIFLILFLSLYLLPANFPAISMTPLISLPPQSQQSIPVDSINADIQQTMDEPPEILRIGESGITENTSLILDPLNDELICPNGLIYESLLEVNDERDEEILPTLATQWVVTNDSKHWTFYLHDDILFHDGSKFNASAVAFNIERILLDYNYSLYTMASNIPLESVEIVNEFQVIIHFFDPYPQLQNLAPYFKIISPNSFNGSDLVSPIGTGPYFVSLDESNSTFLQFYRFDSYHGGLAPFKEIHYYSYNEDGEFEEAINNHKLDFVGLGTYVDSENDPYWEVLEGLDFPYTILGAFNYNNTDLANKNVRKAINYALDNEGLLQVFLETNRKPLRSLLPKGVLGHDPSIKGYPFDLQKANDLLDQEGLVKGENGIRFHLKLVFPPPFWHHSNYVTDCLKQVGIECTMVEDLSFTDLLEAGDFDIGLMVYAPLDPYVTHRLLHSKGEMNYGGYSNSLTDILTIQGQSTPVYQEREFYYREVLKLAQEESPYFLLQTEFLGYWKSKHTAPYFDFNENLRFEFNYTNSEQANHSIKLKIFQSEPTMSKSISNVQVQTESLYFPITDIVITNTDEEPLLVKSILMDHNLSTFISQETMQGKFFLIEVDNPNRMYRLRCYYDLDEVQNMRKEPLLLYEYNKSEQNWIELKTIDSNSSLQFLEVELKGGIRLLRLGKMIIPITFTAFPFVFGISVIMIAIICLTMINNQKLTKYIRKVYK